MMRRTGSAGTLVGARHAASQELPGPRPGGHEDDDPESDTKPSTELPGVLADGERHRMATELLFDRVGVEAGWQVLDLGCGPLDVLAERVGSRGYVIGFDPDQELLTAARKVLAARGVHGVELARGDFDATGGASGSFDLVHARLLLGELARPSATVQEMARLARPGGWVAVQDADLASWTCEPALPAWDRLLDGLTRVWAGDPNMGRRLPQLLRAVGLVDVEVDVHAGVWPSDDPQRGLLPYLVTAHRRRIVADGALTDAELDTALAEVAEHLARPDTLVMGWTLFQAWGRKPLDD
jgi:SAM-dependent methyltransferase